MFVPMIGGCEVTLIKKVKNYILVELEYINELGVATKKGSAKFYRDHIEDSREFNNIVRTDINEKLSKIEASSTLRISKFLLENGNNESLISLSARNGKQKESARFNWGTFSPNIENSIPAPGAGEDQELFIDSRIFGDPVYELYFDNFMKAKNDEEEVAAIIHFDLFFRQVFHNRLYSIILVITANDALKLTMKRQKMNIFKPAQINLSCPKHEDLSFSFRVVLGSDHMVSADIYATLKNSDTIFKIHDADGWQFENLMALFKGLNPGSDLSLSKFKKRSDVNSKHIVNNVTIMSGGEKVLFSTHGKSLIEVMTSGEALLFGDKGDLLEVKTPQEATAEFLEKICLD